MKKYTNNLDISLPIAVWLARDTYDYNPDPVYISATSLLKPMRAIVLSRRETNTIPPDIADFAASRIGTAVHDSIEKAWTNGDSFKRSLLSLGYPQAMIDRILINPKKSEIQENNICMYLEQRAEKAVGDYVISGKFDLVADGILQDIKTTSAYTYKYGSRDESFKLQGSIYRWLNPDIIDAPYIKIQYIFTDWSKAEAQKQKDSNYPQSKIIAKNIPLLSLEETEAYVTQRLELLTKLAHVPEEELPECTDKELWRGESVYKYYKDPYKKSRSTKNFTSLSEANQRLLDDGSVGEVVEVKGTCNACKYCPAFEHCSQKDRLIEEGSLVLT